MPRAVGRCGDGGIEALGRAGRGEMRKGVGGYARRAPSDNERREGRYWMDMQWVRTVR